MDDFPTASFEYGHKIDRAERSAETYRIGGLMDGIDAVEIAKTTLIEAFGVSAQRAETVARAIFARMCKAEHAPILACRVYEVEGEDGG